MKKINFVLGLLVFLGLLAIGASVARWDVVKSKKVIPKYGGTFVYAVESSIETLNPKRVVWFISKNILSLIYDPLISVSSDLTLVPRICESWKMSDENRVFSCKIKEGVAFHNGHILSADDVVFSLNYLLKSDGLDVGDFRLIDGMEEYWLGKTKTIKGIRKSDDYNVNIYLKQEFPSFVSMLASPRIVVLPRDMGGHNENDFFKHPVGSGPFIFINHDSKELQVGVNKEYFLGRPYLDQVVFKTLSTEEAIEGFKAGIVNDVSAYSRNTQFENIPHAVKKMIDSYSSVILFVNNSRPPFVDMRYRKALFSLINRKKIVQECFPQSIIANSIIPQGILGHDTSKSNKYEMYDPDAAYKLLSRLPIREVKIYQGGINKCSQDIINADLERAKVPWVIEGIDNNLLAKKFFSGDLDAHIETDEIKNDEAYTLLKYFESSNSENLSRINDKTIDNLLHDVMLTNDLSKKSEMYKQIDNTILDKAYALPILYPGNYSIIDGRYHGNGYRILTQYIDFAKIWKETN